MQSIILVQHKDSTKKTLCILLCLLLTAACLPSAFAADAAATGTLRMLAYNVSGIPLVGDFQGSVFTTTNDRAKKIGTLLNGTDVDFYKIQLDAGMNYFITPRLHDSYNTGNSTYYTVDAMYAYSTDGVNWSDFYDDVMETFFVRGGSTLYFWIMPYFEGKTGTYQLDIKVVPTTGIDESEEHLFSVYPNPVKDVVNVDCKDIEQIYLFNAVGQNIESFSVEGNDKVQIDMSGLPGGVYILQAVSQGRTLTRQIVKNN